MTRAEVLAFIREEATFEDLRGIREVHIRRLRKLEREAVAAFAVDDRVIFADRKEGDRQATVVRINDKTLTLCLGKGEHVRCSPGFVRKVPTETPTRGEPTGRFSLASPAAAEAAATCR